MVSARGRTWKQWEQRRKQAGARTWASLYQGRPSPDSGGVFPPEEQWERYSSPLWESSYDAEGKIVCRVPGIGRDDHELVQSWDLAFKDTKNSDYVVGQVWLRVGMTAYLLYQVRERLNFSATLKAIKEVSRMWPQAIAKFVEDKANGPAVINTLQQQVIGLIPIEPEGSKYARASAVSPLTESGNVVLPTVELVPSVAQLLEEAKNFPNSSHDDTIDALSQALNRLLLLPILAEDQYQEHEVYDIYREQGWSVSPV